MSGDYTLGAYRLIAELGHGGMADVFLAAVEGPSGSGFTKLAVVKKLRRHLAEDPEFVAMLMDEARITARLTHPNVIQLFELAHADGQYFLAMEYLDGQPLNRVTQRASRLRPELSKDVMYSVVADVLAGLHHAHELRDYDGTPLDVVHRDVTPHNVFVTYDGTVKVVDFGIAKAAGRATETQCGIIKGKVRYMSPEQATGRHADRRTDVFATGVMLWNAATGKRLWGRRDDLDIARALAVGDYNPSPRAESPAVPDAIDMICQRALAFRREDRYATAEEMRSDLEAFLGEGSADARRLLATTMKELFETDRAKVRAVLEASTLTSPVVVRPRSAHGETTRMVVPSPTPVAVDVGAAFVPRAPPSVAPLAYAVEPRAGATRRTGGKHGWLAAATAALALSALLAVSAPAVMRATASEARGATPVVRTVAADLITSSPGAARAKARPPVAGTEAPTRSKKSAAEKSSASRRASVAPSKGAARPPADDAAAPAVEGVAGKAAPAGARLLDGADPWTR